MSRTRPERDAQEQATHARHYAGRARRIVLSADDEHAAPEECPERKAEETERNRDRELAFPHRDAVAWAARIHP